MDFYKQKVRVCSLFFSLFFWHFTCNYW